MSIIYLNGFEWNSQYEGCFRQNTATWSTSSPFSGTYCLYFDNTADYFTTSNFGDVTEFYLQFYFKWSTLSGTPAFITWLDDTTVIGTLSISSTSQTLEIWRGDKSASCGTGTTVINSGRWYLIEIYGLIDSSSGTYTVKVNGTQDITFSGATSPGSSTINALKLRSQSTSGNYAYCYFDDVIVCDTSGSINNTWVGGQKIVLLRPHAKGSNTQWQKTNGIDNYWCVDGAPSLTPSEYVYTSLDSQTDLYIFEDLPLDAYNVTAVRVDAWAAKNSGADLTLELALLPSGLTLAYSSGIDLSVAYALQSWLVEAVPGGTYWTTSDVNALEAGMRSAI